MGWITFDAKDAGGVTRTIRVWDLGSSVWAQGFVPLRTYAEESLQSPSAVITASGNTAILAGSGGEFIKLWGFMAFANVPTNIELRSGTTTVKLARVNLSAGAPPFILPKVLDEPWFMCADGEALNINLEDAGSVTYLALVTRG